MDRPHDTLTSPSPLSLISQSLSKSIIPYIQGLRSWVPTFPAFSFPLLPIDHSFLVLPCSFSIWSAVFLFFRAIHPELAIVPRVSAQLLSVPEANLFFPLMTIAKTSNPALAARTFIFFSFCCLSPHGHMDNKSIGKRLYIFIICKSMSRAHGWVSVQLHRHAVP